MGLHGPPNSKFPILALGFNQDTSCVALGTKQGIAIYNLQTHQCIYRYTIGAISNVEMLFCTSLLGFVGAGEQPTLTPRKLTVMNTATGRSIQDLSFETSVLAVLMNNSRLVAVLERKTCIYALQTLSLMRTIDTADNPRGVAALTACDHPNLLALPTEAATGTLRVYDLCAEGGNVLAEVRAHRAPLAALSWSADGSLLVSASVKGTVVRVHRLPSTTKVYSFRRGTYPATIHSLAFSPPAIQPPLLAAASSRGTVHLFRLEDTEAAAAAAAAAQQQQMAVQQQAAAVAAGGSPGGGGAAPAAAAAARAAASAAAGLISAVIKYSVPDMVEPLRAIATVKLPCAEAVPAACAITMCTHPEPPHAAAPVAQASSACDTDAVNLVVATLEGVLYEYRISDLHNATATAGPVVALDNEHALK